MPGVRQLGGERGRWDGKGTERQIFVVTEALSISVVMGVTRIRARQGDAELDTARADVHLPIVTFRYCHVRCNHWKENGTQGTRKLSVLSLRLPANLELFQNRLGKKKKNPKYLSVQQEGISPRSCGRPIQSNDVEPFRKTK